MLIAMGLLVQIILGRFNCLTSRIWKQLTQTLSCCIVQIRVYPLADIRMGDVESQLEPVSAAFIHRLPSKMSSIAWSPFDEV